MPTGIFRHKPLSEKHKYNISLGLVGIHRSEETRKKMSLAKKGQIPWSKGKHLSEETKRKISEANKDRKPAKQAIEASIKTRLGKHLSQEHKNKIGKSQTGEKHHDWRGGISIKYPMDWTDDLRESIRKRDDYFCQMCGIHQEELTELRNKKLDIHHIDYNSDNLDPENLISLCRNCHMKTNFNRNYWIKFFEI